MRSLRSGTAIAAIAVLWSSTAFGFNLFGSSDDSAKKPKPAPQAQAQQQKQDAETPSVAKTLEANLGTEIEKAKAQRVAGDLAGAAHSFAQMVLVAPDNAEVCGEYGKTLVLLGRSDDAIAFLKRAIQLKPNDWTYYSAIGAAFDQKNEFADAKTAYQRGLQINPKSAALLNNYAMSRMLAGDLPGAQSLIAQAQAAGSDPKITSNAALMANLRGQRTADATPIHPVVTPSVVPAAALPKPVVTAPLPAPVARPVKAAVAAPAPVPAIAKPVPQPVKAAVAIPVTPAPQVKPVEHPVKTAVATPAPQTAPAQKPIIVKTEEGRVMMQAVPKDPKAGPVKSAEASEPVKAQAAPVQDAKSEATGQPRALASAIQAPAAHVTPDLRSASD